MVGKQPRPGETCVHGSSASHHFVGVASKTTTQITSKGDIVLCLLSSYICLMQLRDHVYQIRSRKNVHVEEFRSLSGSSQIHLGQAP